MRLFGRRHEEVHRWLDEFMGTERYGMRHRRVSHHEEGIRRVIRLFGEEAGRTARQHIISDLKKEGWTENQVLGFKGKVYAGVLCACDQTRSIQP
jgi:hypothetical protein